jgi:hypothetical protein
MAQPHGARIRYWRQRAALALIVAAVSAAGAGCGDDSSPSQSLGGSSAGGSGGEVDAGTPPASPGGASGAGGSEFVPPLGGLGGSVDASGPTSGGPCAEGEARECTFDRLCTGTATCGSDGLLGPCECGTSGLVGSGIVGSRCESDADCGGGGTCLLADSNSYLGAGGPAGGYCTFSCTITSEDPYADDCATHDAESLCGPFGPDGSMICIRTCLSLDPDPGEAKCLNRPDLMCLSQAASGGVPFNGTRELGYCKPQCGSDAECPAGRFCHSQAGICTTAQVQAAPVGARCNLDTDCNGRACEDRDDENIGTCTGPCVLGSLSGCGFGHDASPRDIACLQPAVAAGRFSEGPGDAGLCRELCDVAEDCERFADGWVCTEINAGAQDFFGRPGACTPPP